MNKKQKDQRNNQSDIVENVSSVGNEREDPQTNPDHPFPTIPSIPPEPDENPALPCPEPGIEEPEKDDPTRIEEQPPIFNNQLIMAKYSKKAQEKIEEVMHEFKHGELKSGKGGKGGIVKNRKQAIAIGISEAREAGLKVPKEEA